MNIEETRNILSVVKASYPNHYKSMKAEEGKALMQLWQSLFNDEKYQQVALAVKIFIERDTKGFPPVIGQIKEIIRNATKTDVIGEGVAWQMVCDALTDRTEANFYYEMFPNAVKKAVGSPSQLKEWAVMNNSDIQTIIHSQFKRAYREALAEEEIQSHYTEETRGLLNGTLGTDKLLK